MFVLLYQNHNETKTVNLNNYYFDWNKLKGPVESRLLDYFYLKVNTRNPELRIKEKRDLR